MPVQKVIGTWELHPACAYLVGVVLIPLVARLTLAFLRGAEFWAQERKNYWKGVCHYFGGLDRDPLKGDYWVPFALGLF